MDHLEESEGTQWSFRADGEYDLNTNWLDSIKFGARYADRDQTVAWSTYNWANVANTWRRYAAGLLESRQPYAVGFVRGIPEGLYEVSEFGADFFGGSLGSFPFVPRDALRDHRPDEYSRDLIGVGEFRPICTRLNELPDSCFVDNEIADVSENDEGGLRHASLRRSRCAHRQCRSFWQHRCSLRRNQECQPRLPPVPRQHLRLRSAGSRSGRCWSAACSAGSRVRWRIAAARGGTAGAASRHASRSELLLPLRRRSCLHQRRGSGKHRESEAQGLAAKLQRKVRPYAAMAAALRRIEGNVPTGYGAAEELRSGERPRPSFKHRSE